MKTILLTVTLVALLVLYSGIHATAGTVVGGALENDFTDESLWYGGFLRTGGLFKLELGGTKPYSGSSGETKLFSYFLVNLNLGSVGVSNGSLNLYFGASPEMTLDTSTPSFSISDSSGYGKMGLQLNLFPFSVQVESKGRFKFSGNLTNLLGGLGIGLTF